MTTRPWFWNCSWMRSRCGMLARHGAHHVAQKSSTTGWPLKSDRRSARPSSERTENGAAGSAPAVEGEPETAADRHMRTHAMGNERKDDSSAVGCGRTAVCCSRPACLIGWYRQIGAGARTLPAVLQRLD